MRVCIDARAVGPRMHGIARYALNLVRGIAALGSGHEFYVIGRNQEAFSFLSRTAGRIRFAHLQSEPYSLAEQLTVPWVVSRIEPELYHCLTYACPVLVPSPVCMTVHDLLPLARPNDFGPGLRGYYKSFVRLAASKASKVLVDSRSTACRCYELLGIPLEKIAVVPLAGDHMVSQPHDQAQEKIRRHWGLDRAPYFLCIANPRPHKRVRFLVEVFLSTPVLRDHSVRLIVIGTRLREQCGSSIPPDRAGQICWLEHVSDTLLSMLYQNAVALLCPSVGEGFGLPAVEAMTLGVPVVAAASGAFPELLKDCGLLVPEDDRQAWAAALQGIFLDRGKRLELAARAARKAGRYSWKGTAATTIAVYEEVLGHLRSGGPNRSADPVRTQGQPGDVETSGPATDRAPSCGGEEKGV